jgi:hypothetical protein
MEIGFPFLIWLRRTRWVMLGMAVAMHTGIALFMGLNTFSLFMLTLLMAFIPLEALAWAFQAMGRGAPALQLTFNRNVRRQVRAASLVRAFDAWDQVGIREGEQLELVTETGDVRRGFALFEHLAYSLRLLWPLVPLAWLLSVTSMGRVLFPSAADATKLSQHSDNGKRHSKGEKATVGQIPNS